MFREDSKEGGSGPDFISKVLPCSGTGSATLWVGNLGVDGSDDAKNLGGTLGFTVEGDRDEGLKSGG